MCILLAGKVFPFPTFVLTGAFVLGRILHQAGYSKSGYGGHALGFVVAMISTVTLEML